MLTQNTTITRSTGECPQIFTSHMYIARYAYDIKFILFWQSFRIAIQSVHEHMRARMCSLCPDTNRRRHGNDGTINSNIG